MGEVRFPDGAWQPAPCLRCHQEAQKAAFIREAVQAQAERSSLYAEATLEEFVTELPHQHRGLAAARAFLETVRPNSPIALILYANSGDGATGYGTGKTHLASAIANELRARGWDVDTWVVPEFLAQIKATYSDSSKSEWDLVRRASQCDLLVLDDLGKEYVKDLVWFQEKMFLIVNARARRGPMVITTNLGPRELAARVGGAAFSRLWQMCGGGDEKLLVDMCGPDWRFGKPSRVEDGQ